MTPRITQLRHESQTAIPRISIERARLVTAAYRENLAQELPIAKLRALSFSHVCEHKTLYLGERELIVGERGPHPKAVTTYPEIICHSADDLTVLNARETTYYRVAAEDIAAYQKEIIPFWSGRSLRDLIFANLPSSWLKLYDAGLFTEFMEQRAPGHTALDGTIYHKGMRDFKEEIQAALDALAMKRGCEAQAQRDELEAMTIACDAMILLAHRHAELAEARMKDESDPKRRAELATIAANCRIVPEFAPRTFHQALQMYWFVHLGIITELNGWDAMNPGHLDQHLLPFYTRDLACGRLDRAQAKELIACLFIKFNNHPAPPKVGVTAAESGTYNDFININIGGVDSAGEDGSNEISRIILEVADELALLQPQCNMQIAKVTPDEFLLEGLRVVRHGLGYPSLFNTDAVIAEQIRQGKSLQDAREGGCSGCIETVSFGKEAAILTGYLNVPKILELALNNGRDQLTGKLIGPQSGKADELATFEDLYRAFEQQLAYVVGIKTAANDMIEQLCARHLPAPLLSTVIHDCIKQGRDYYAGGARYDSTYIQCCGIGTITDSLSALKKHVYDDQRLSFHELLQALTDDFAQNEALRLFLVNKTPCFGNDDAFADALMQRVFNSLWQAIDGRPNTKGGTYHIDMLSTTCHVYFGKKLGASASGRKAGEPESDGTSPSQGRDRCGPTAVLKSLGKMDQIKTGGTLLNQRFLPATLATEESLLKLKSMVRAYFKMMGHHIQFNVVDTLTLQDAQRHPEKYADLLVRVAGYSDYFVDIGRDLQNEIIARSVQALGEPVTA